MFDLTADQRFAVTNGDPVRLAEDGMEIVVVRADVFDRMLDEPYDDSPWTDDEMDRLASENADLLGWEGMDAYQDET